MHIFEGLEDGTCVGLNAGNILWIEEIEPLKKDGKSIPLLKAASVYGEIEIRSEMNSVFSKGDFEHWLDLTLHSGRAVMVNRDKLDGLTEVPGGTDVHFINSDGSEGQTLCVRESREEIQKQFFFDACDVFNELVAKTTTNEVILFAGHKKFRQEPQ